MRAGGRRALVGVLSVGAILVSAAGIAYMGAVSFPDEVGSVDARRLEHRRQAEAIAADLEAQLERALDAAAAALAQPGQRERLAAAEPVASRPFTVSATGELAHPPREPLRGAGALTPELPERGFVRRQRALEHARVRERGRCSADTERCQASERDRREARRLYRSLLRHDDTAPEALLGLARLDRRSGAADVAAARYRELGERFRQRHDVAGVAYGLLADLGVAELSAGAGPFLDLYRALLDRTYAAPAAALDVVAERCRAALAERALDPAQSRELASLDARFERARADAAFAAQLERELAELTRTASRETTGRAALWPAERTLVYRQESDGAVVGLALGRAELTALASELAGAAGLRDDLSPVLYRVDDPQALDGPRRVMATVGFGQPLPHLGLALVSDASVPDALDELARARRRHRAITGGLVGLLALGLFATVRGAARERELARLKSDFVSTVSHELKTPLTSIRMFAEMLREGVAGDDREREARYHEIIVKESERLGLLIANLLDYAQIERGTRRYTPRPEGAEEIAREAVETFHRLREGEGQLVEVDVAASARGAELLVDREVVVQSLLNLLSNAAKYGGKGVIRLGIAALDDGAAVSLAVADDGPGIPVAEQPRVFREFYRAPAARASAVEGTGLGLALVKRHVESQGGRVDLDSALGRGSTFTIVLPRAS